MPSHAIETRTRSRSIVVRMGACMCALLLGPALSACSPPARTAGQPAKAVTYAAPDPVDIGIRTDAKSASASASVVTAAGGKVTAVGADGTRFTLTLPSGALRGSERIILTPVLAATGLPFSGGLAGAVQMAPEGLRLLKPAVLSIESPKTVASKGFETVAFAYHGDGKGLYLSPFESKGRVLSLELWHFSGAGAANGTSAEVATQQTKHVPSSAEDAFTQRVAEYIGSQRQIQLMGQGEPDPQFENRMVDFTLEAYNRFVRPYLPIALKDCKKAPAIMSRALSWARMVQLMPGMDSPKGRKVQALVDGVMDTFAKVRKKCWQGYTATGTYGDGTFFGSIPSLEEPFTITVTAPGASTELRFTPSGPEAGSFTIAGHAAGGAVFSGKGTYTVKGAGTTSPELITSDAGTTKAPGMGLSWGHNVPIPLVPKE
jgi:hypothetical protein